MEFSPTSRSKYANEVLDYTFDMANTLDSGDTISTFSVSAESGLTVDSSSNTSTVGTATISGGTQGSSYKLTLTFVTSNSRTFVGYVTINII